MDSIIKSKYSVNDIAEFVEAERNSIGENNIKYIEKLEKAASVLKSIIAFLSGIAIGCVFNLGCVFNIINRYISIIVCCIIVAIFFTACYLLSTTTTHDLTDFTVKILRRKGIRPTHIVSKRFIDAQIAHIKLCELQDFISSHMGAYIEPYTNDGVLRVSYITANLKCIHEFKLEHYIILEIIRDNQINCSCLDSYLESCLMNYNY